MQEMAFERPKLQTLLRAAGPWTTLGLCPHFSTVSPATSFVPNEMLGPGRIGSVWIGIEI